MSGRELTEVDPTSRDGAAIVSDHPACDRPGLPAMRR
jgi:hypothetical protein